jgi:tetratricopeptide (TPR) repeat protein
MVQTPGIIQNWVTYYVALFLTKDYTTCLEVFDSIVSQTENNKNVKERLKAHEMSEIYLFKGRVLESMGEPKKAIKFLLDKKAEATILDDIAKYEMLARLFMKINQRAKAVQCMERLLKMNSSNKQIYVDILRGKGVNVEDQEAMKNPETQQKFLDVLQHYREVLPKSNSHLRLIVDCLPASSTFRDHLIQYMRPLVIKGVPSLINDLRKSIYCDAEKTKIIGEVLLQMNKCMESEMCLDERDEEEQDPTV